METGLQALRPLSCCHPAFRPWQEILDGQICQTLGPNPQAVSHNPIRVCWCLCTFVRMIVCALARVCACIWCITRVAWSDSPAGPLPLSKRRGEKLCQLFFYHIPAISFSDRLRLFTGAKIQDSVILPDVCPGQTAHLAFSIRSTWCTASCVCIWFKVLFPS